MDLNDLKLEPISEKDFSILVKAFQNYSLELDANSHIRGIHAENFIKTVLKNPKRNVFWLSSLRNKLGFSIVTMERLWPDVENFIGKINEFYVFPEYRQQGVGKHFVALLNDYFKENKCKQIELEVLFSNERGFSFWKSFGFETKKYLMQMDI